MAIYDARRGSPSIDVIFNLIMSLQKANFFMASSLQSLTIPKEVKLIAFFLEKKAKRS
jgi:hypothetical protein